MAEVIGVISGAVTIGALAANIAMSVAKLRTYWEQLENAPADIRRLMDEVEILSLILEEIKNDQARNPISSLVLDNSSLPRCLDHCQKAAERLSLLTDEMGKSLESSGRLRKRWHSVKVVLKKDKVDTFRLELESAIRLLSLSHQSYTRVLLSLQPDIIYGRVSKAIDPGTFSNTTAIDDNELSSPSSISQNLSTSSEYSVSRSPKFNYFWQTTPAFDVFGSLSYVTKESAGKKYPGRKDHDDKEYLQIVASYRGPAWLINKTWTFHATRSCSGWDFSIRQSNIVPGNSLIFSYAKSGNVTGLQKLFDDHQASVLDCDDYGWTALHFAILHGRYSMCKLLIDLGSNVNSFIGLSWSPIKLAISHTFGSCGQDRVQEAQDISRLLLFKAEVDPDEMRYYQGKTEGFVFWQQYIYPHYYDAPMEKRVRMAIKLALSSLSGPTTFRRALAQGEIPCTAVNLRSSCGQTLLHAVASSIAKLQASGGYNSHEKDADTMRWQAIIQELVTKGAYIHARTCASLTPLDSLLHRYFQFRHATDSYRLHIVLKNWLTGLIKCGVDLCAYGKREVDMHQEGETRWEFMVSEGKDSRGLVDEIYSVTNFTYGSSPDDWQITLELSDEETDGIPDWMAATPGGWIEER